MKATGIVRRIDDLGRVVIPKEIRRTLKIREGEPLEIFTDRNGEVILKKYAPINDLSIYAQEYCDVLADTLSVIAAVSDDISIIAVAGGPKKEFMGQKLGSIGDALTNGKSQITSGTITENGREFSTLIVSPILTNEVIGSVILAPKKDGQVLGETEKNLAYTAANFLAKQMQRND
ncbi:MAG: AbrB/MazE/SpoVT family DNA-binding domain-containing protein [Clostridia bacterium]|jgi:AbrB family transcriptional regulator (stage V sporulation protein T)|uniref:stage V sporulation T C-terminal domain-containing protein n=1 Tax=Desulfitibacter alkalitolerans TaxID=264641 RepID=UPI000488DF77|nr:stage V sporulation T C-terminal domain-containing protein [Desulfitibacter alkalitolerans]MBS3970255.1 AbrB/MazE/SpoVT family DNA-binding domain-containing protein [Clostridia bacterium]